MIEIAEIKTFSYELHTNFQQSLKKKTFLNSQHLLEVKNGKQ